ncbi:MAG TPA: hypothetical protein VFG14_11650 [Chthoniobacteraceae bacterium]|nr:hypothetical protein [Chthoniobacteraceae bacterium]
MKALISCIVSLLLLVVGVVASWFVWFRPKAAPIVAVQQAAAEAAQSTVEAITGKKFVIDAVEKGSDDLPRRSGANSEPENGLFSDRERQESEAQARKQREEDARLRPLVYPQAQEVVRKELAFPQMAKFSILQPQDDQFSICRRVRGGLWESRGVADHVDTAGKKQRSVWRVLHRSAPDGNIETLYIEVGKTKKGSMDAAVKASLAGDESK